LQRGLRYAEIAEAISLSNCTIAVKTYRARWKEGVLFDPVWGLPKPSRL
jgi:hypothetical protein